MKLSFKCRRAGGGGKSIGGDIYVSAVHAGKDRSRYAICARLSGDTLRRLRWMLGDKVTFDFQREADTDIWTFSRVTGGDPEGLKISDNGLDSGCGSVRTSCDFETMKSIFTGDKRGYTGTLVEHDNRRAVFIFDSPNTR